MRHLAFTLVAFVTGCSTAPHHQSPESPGFAVYITGYEVPKPDSIPFAEPEPQHEYLRFYHYAYLTTMWEDWPSSSSISPISNHPQAATAGHYAGQDDAHRDKTDYWSERGRAYSRSGVGLANHRLQLTGDARDGESAEAGDPPPRAAGN